MTSEKDVWNVTDLLIDARHFDLIPDKVARSLPRLDRRRFEAGMHGYRSSIEGQSQVSPLLRAC